METVTHATPAGTEVQEPRTGRWSMVLRHTTGPDGTQFTYVRDLSGPKRGTTRRVRTATLRVAL